MTPHRPTLGLRALVPVTALLLFAALALPVVAQAQSSNVALLSNVDEDPGYNDIWGYTAPNGDEYAIVGTTSGTAFYNVTIPTAPVRVGYIDGPDSTWRDMKTFGNHCYIVTEGTGGANTGLQIVSLANPESPTQVGLKQDFSSAHNIFIDENGRIYVVGADNGMRIYDAAANATNPPLLGVYTDDYVHDIYVKNNIAYLGAINVSQCVILDVTNPASTVELSRFTYPGAATHQTWTNEDQTVLVISDETSGGRLTFWDVSDPSNPVFLDDYVAAASASAHNAFIRGDLCYVSYYTEGLRIVSLGNPSSVSEVGFYDTFQGGGLYAGAWGCYPFAAQEGIVYISDISNGLFVLQFTANFGSLSGQVTDADSGLPVEGALVEFVEAEQSRVTDAGGNYFIDLAPGSYTVDVSRFGYNPASSGGNVTSGQTSVVNVEITALPSGSLAGTITESPGVAGGAPIDDANISLDGTPLVDVSAEGGTYAFPLVPVGTYGVTVERFRYVPTTASATINLDQPTTLDVQMDDAFFWTEMESDPGWTTSGTASTGLWVRVEPIGTGGGSVQPEFDHTIDPGENAWVTGQGSPPPGGSIGQNDVDGGTVELTTNAYNLDALGDPIIQYHRWFVNDAGSNPGEDPWRVEISPDGQTWIQIEATLQSTAAWTLVETRVRDFLPEPTPLTAVQVRFRTQDLGSGGSIVEAGVDDFQIFDAAPGTVGIGDAAQAPARSFALLGNSPNPFNPSTSIRFELPAAEAVSLKVFDVSGRMIRELLASERLEAGPQSVQWDGRTHAGQPAASGVYFYRVEAGDLSETRRMVLAK